MGTETNNIKTNNLKINNLKTDNKEKRILITGGATGLGQAIALALSEQYGKNGEKLKVCIADIHEQRGQETLALLTEKGTEAFYQPCDITQDDDVANLVTAIEARWGGVDVVFNNAGVASGGSLSDESIAQWKWIFDINLLGMVRVSKAMLPLFKAQRSGYFVNIASQAGLTPIPYMNSYNAVKAAVVSLSETMKLELAPDNIDVSVVCPSFFKTNLDESMRSDNPAMHKMMARFFKKADMTKEQVAQSICDQVAQKRFLILTHKLGKRAFLMKKLLPTQMYINNMLKQTKAMKRAMERR
ncbi:NADP-dependent 3-hydroxy acid dehydrogenase YdfG [Alteromonas sp. 76-1]|uniref:SDR family oxidoreductase n=1 Tax=Alteromonas sp. 76-1 TaxID=2358187 RepID=UPI000FD169E3|nr:SDR family oxidoreductase [Alteromonas sp. 76-1]VEL97786.1 NADP-dependent 3-hydroxy acid dehydrogenase YdfG [Alteromonas sp. 76-1]